MSIGIYKITNTVNGKVYIGQSINIEKRWKRHIYELSKNRHGNLHLQSAWNKYGSSSFVFKVLKICSKEKLNYYETYYWEQYRNNCYNLHKTGEAHNVSEETKKKISESSKRKYELHPELRELHRKLRAGKPVIRKKPRKKITVKELRKIKWKNKKIEKRNKLKEAKRIRKLKEKIRHMKLTKRKILKIRQEIREEFDKKYNR